MKFSQFAVLSLMTILILSCSDSEDYQLLVPEQGEQLSGGSSTVTNSSVEAFGFASSQLTSSEAADFGVGNSFFRQNWIMAPSSTTLRDGIGPFFNAISCASCHFKDGRGRPPTFDGEFGKGLLLRLSVAGSDPHGGPMGDPIYGAQLQDRAILGQATKGDLPLLFRNKLKLLLTELL